MPGQSGSVVNRAFAAAERQIKDLSELRTDSPEHHEAEGQTGQVVRLFSEQGCGFIEIPVSYRDYQGCIVDVAGRTVLLDMEVFEEPHIRDWFRDFCCAPCPPTITPYVRGEEKERVRILATILLASYMIRTA